ncbi:MAG: hypothetical protein GVX78_03945, partial [Bacteroidetes bacterium]|nr:hypothetical protein [Bacteroidota bacterium]
MKNQLVIPFIICCFGALLSAQDDNWKEKIESQKVAFITNELNFTPKEAREFWPLYNEHQGKKEELLSQHRTEGSEIQNL